MIALGNKLRVVLPDNVGSELRIAARWTLVGAAGCAQTRDFKIPDEAYIRGTDIVSARPLLFGMLNRSVTHNVNEENQLLTTPAI